MTKETSSVQQLKVFSPDPPLPITASVSDGSTNMDFQMEWTDSADEVPMISLVETIFWLSHDIVSCILGITQS